MIDEERQLWRVGEIECVMISCCTGAELQLRRVLPGEPGAVETVLRELYPAKTDLYERARDLKNEQEGRRDQIGSRR